MNLGISGRGALVRAASKGLGKGCTAATLTACPQTDILVNNAGSPPPSDFRTWNRDAWLQALDANMLAPIALIKATVDAMAERGFGRLVSITSAAAKVPIDILGLSNGAHSGLTGFVAGVAHEAQLDTRRMLNPTQRFGTVAKFGAACAFLCSVHVGNITGQNILPDGGAYPGTM